MTALTIDFLFYVKLFFTKREWPAYPGRHGCYPSQPSVAPLAPSGSMRISARLNSTGPSADIANTLETRDRSAPADSKHFRATWTRCHSRVGRVPRSSVRATLPAQDSPHSTARLIGWGGSDSSRISNAIAALRSRRGRRSTDSSVDSRTASSVLPGQLMRRASPWIFRSVGVMVNAAGPEVRAIWPLASTRVSAAASRSMIRQGAEALPSNSTISASSAVDSARGAMDLSVGGRDGQRSRPRGARDLAACIDKGFSRGVAQHDTPGGRGTAVEQHDIGIFSR